MPNHGRRKLVYAVMVAATVLGGGVTASAAMGHPLSASNWGNSVRPGASNWGNSVRVEAASNWGNSIRPGASNWGN